MIGDPAFALVGEYRTKEKKQKKIPILPAFFHTPSADWRRRLATSPFSVILFITIPGLFIDRGLRYRPSG